MRILSFVAATILCVVGCTNSLVQQQSANEVSPDTKAWALDLRDMKMGKRIR